VMGLKENSFLYNMMKKPQVKYLLAILMILAFSSAGCAHKPRNPSDTAPTGSMSRQNRPLKQAQAAQASAVENKPDANDYNDAFAEFKDEFGSGEGIRLVADPIAPWNKLMFHFNDKLYFWFLKPVARGYRALVPGVIRQSVANFFYNVTAPARFVNCLLQGKGREASFEVGSFMLNSTVGILGFRDLTQKQREQMPTGEDLGQTLGSYRIGNGFYIVWPLFGPSTLRDTVGMVGDAFMNPIRYIDPAELGWSLSGYEFLNDVSFHIGDYETLKEAAIDPYEAFKDAYVRSRIKKVNN
jgi:phospholipid-binding lipoprotein MlaA